MQPINFERYVETFYILEKYSEEYPFMLRHLLDFTENKFPDGFSMLDIGAGTGNFTASFLRDCHVPVAWYTAIEPSPEHVASLNKNLEAIPVEYNIINDYFSPETDTGEKYDLVLLSHSTYCFLPAPEPHLLHALTLIRDGGYAVIYNGTSSNFCYILNLLLRDILPEKRVTDPTFTSWKIRDILEKNGIDHSVEYLPGTLRAKEIFSPENTKLLHDLITFSLMVEIESMGPKTVERTAEFLKMISYPSAEGPMLNLGTDAIVVGPKTKD